MSGVWMVPSFDTSASVVDEVQRGDANTGEDGPVAKHAVAAGYGFTLGTPGCVRPEVASRLRARGGGPFPPAGLASPGEPRWGVR